MNEDSMDLSTAAEPVMEHVLDGLIDYAGLFPPASCSLKETISNHAVFLKGGDGWMVGRLILPAHLLEEASVLATQAGAEPGDAAWFVSALLKEAKAL